MLGAGMGPRQNAVSISADFWPKNISESASLNQLRDKAVQRLLLESALAFSDVEMHPKLQRALLNLSAQFNTSFTQVLTNAEISQSKFYDHLPRGDGLSLYKLAAEDSPRIFVEDLLGFILSHQHSPQYGAQVPPLLRQLRTFVKEFMASEEAVSLLEQINANLALHEGTAPLSAQAGFALRQLGAQFPNNGMIGGLALSMPLQALTRYALVSRGVSLFRAQAAALAVDGLAFTAGEGFVHGLQGIQDPRNLGTRLWQNYRMLLVMRGVGGAVGTAARIPLLQQAMAKSILLKTGVEGLLPHVSALGALSVSEMTFNDRTFGESLFPSAMGVLHFVGAKAVLASVLPKLSFHTQQLEQATQKAFCDRAIQARTWVRTFGLDNGNSPSGNRFALAVQGFVSSSSLPALKANPLDLVAAMAMGEGGRGVRQQALTTSLTPTRPKRSVPGHVARLRGYLFRTKRLLSELGYTRLTGTDAGRFLRTLATRAERTADQVSPEMYDRFLTVWENLDFAVRTWAPRSKNGATNPRVEVLETLLTLSNNFGRDHYAFGAGVTPVLRAWEKSYGLSAATPEGWRSLRDSLIRWSSIAQKNSSHYFFYIPQLLAVASKHHGSPEQAIVWIHKAYIPWEQAVTKRDLYPVNAAKAEIEGLALEAASSYSPLTPHKSARAWEPTGSGMESTKPPQDLSK